jgi:hypothetical protein
LLYLGLVIIKTFHEFGHAYFTRNSAKYVMGVLLMIFTPVPYMDRRRPGAFARADSSSWSGRGDDRRVFWARGLCVGNTGQGALGSLASHFRRVGLHDPVQRQPAAAFRRLLHARASDPQQPSGPASSCATVVAGTKKSESPSRNAREAVWFTFRITSGIYRVIIFGGILLVIPITS